jgi:hypothetical protein
LRFSSAAARRIGRLRTVTLKVVAVAVDPAMGHAGGATEIVPRATGKRK